MTPGVIECKRPDGGWDVVAEIDVEFYGGVRMRLRLPGEVAAVAPAIPQPSPNGVFTGTYPTPADRGKAGHPSPPRPGGPP